MGKTFRNSKQSFDDDYDGNYSNVKNKRKNQKNMRKIRSSKKHYENFDTDENEYSLHYR
jgi:hypothetical protein